MNSPPSSDKQLALVRFSAVSDVIFFSPHRSLTEGCFLQIKSTPTHRACCTTKDSGDLQDGHIFCKKPQAGIRDNKQAAAASAATSNSKGEAVSGDEQTIPFSHLLIDTAQAMPLTSRLQCYAKIVRFQIKKYLDFSKDKRNPLSQHKQKCLFAQLTSKLLTHAYETAVYPLSAYYVPLLISTIKVNSRANSASHLQSMLAYCTKFTYHDGVAQRFFLRGLEDSLIDFHRLSPGNAEQQRNLTRRICDTFNQLYLIDALDKSPILAWYDDDKHNGEGLQDYPEYHQIYANLPYFFCQGNASTRQDFARAKQFRHFAHPFVHWLKFSQDEEE